jgi:hypothetical protein
MKFLGIVIVLIDAHAHSMCTDYKYVPTFLKVVIFSVQFHLRLLRLQYTDIHISFNQTTNIVF